MTTIKNSQILNTQGRPSLKILWLSIKEKLKYLPQNVLYILILLDTVNNRNRLV